jgi:hypothetical protein
MISRKHVERAIRPAMSELIRARTCRFENRHGRLKSLLHGIEAAA